NKKETHSDFFHGLTDGQAPRHSPATRFPSAPTRSIPHPNTAAQITRSSLPQNSHARAAAASKPAPLSPRSPLVKPIHTQWATA
uniref:Uncharacterized protein n=1 Tax=Aegilops tauschii subsp. strangulata TaxID=200361 RepID=A0A453F2S3_AEGTS